jgi:hypothetical protein
MKQEPSFTHSLRVSERGLSAAISRSRFSVIWSVHYNVSGSIWRDFYCRALSCRMFLGMFETPLLHFSTLYMLLYEASRRAFAVARFCNFQSSISKLRQQQTLHHQKCRPHTCADQRIRHGNLVWGPGMFIGQGKMGASAQPQRSHTCAVAELCSRRQYAGAVTGQVILVGSLFSNYKRPSAVRLHAWQAEAFYLFESIAHTGGVQERVSKHF